MSDPQNDPSGNTEAFRAFVHSAAETESANPGGRPWIFAAMAAALVVVAVVVWLLVVR
jgi:hypothetical protein